MNVDVEEHSPETRCTGFLLAFSLFVSGYYKHGDVNDPDTYEATNPFADPAPTWQTLTPEERDAMYDPVPRDVRGGMDVILMDTGISVGAFQAFREAALRFPKANGMGPEVGGWDRVEVRHVWGDHSVASMVFAMYSLRSELRKKAGKRLRDVSFVRVEGGNHLQLMV